MIRLLPLLFLLGCFPDARFVMQESVNEYECAPEMIAEICATELEKRNGI